MAIQEDNDYFTALNDDCIFEVLSRLPISDFGAISQTCQKLKELTGNHIKRRHPELIPEELVITMLNGIVDFFEQKNYIKCIRQYVNKIHIIVKEDESCDRFVEFIQENCGKNIKIVRLCGSNWTKSFGEGIKCVLENIQTVMFIGSKNHFDHILCECPNIKQLEIFEYNFDATTLPQSHYPTLEVFEFECFEWGSNSFDNLAAFFQRNPQIKRFIVKNFQSTIMNKRLLSMLVESTNIDELFLHLRDRECDFRELHSEFKMLTDRDNFKRLELKGGDERTINALGQLQHFTNLHLRKYWKGASININQLINLKTLRLDGFNLNEATATAMAQHLQSLEQFHYEKFYPPIEIKECIKPFVRYSKKLTEMVVVTNDLKDNNKDMPKLNTERRKLANTSKLIIFIDDCCNVNWIKTMNGVENDLVDIQSVKV